MKINIRKLYAQGIVCNVTTNQKTGATEGIEFYSEGTNPEAIDALRSALKPFDFSDSVQDMALGEMIATLTKAGVLGAMS